MAVWLLRQSVRALAAAPTLEEFMAIVTDEEDQEPTPEQKAEILGEEPGEKDTPSDDEPKEKKAKPDLKVVGKPDKETPPATFPKSQEEWQILHSQKMAN
jgi:hypothetical protein